MCRLFSQKENHAVGCAHGRQEFMIMNGTCGTSCRFARERIMPRFFRLPLCTRRPSRPADSCARRPSRPAVFSIPCDEKTTSSNKPRFLLHSATELYR